MRRAGIADRPRIEAFLRIRAVTSMFPLSNLARHGMDGDHGRSMSFWVAEDAQGITDIIAQTREGLVMPSCDTAPWEDAASALHGREAIGVIGAREQSRPLIAALGLADAEAELDEDEPHFALTLADLVVPDGPGDLVPMFSVDRALMVDWRRRYCEEVLGAPAVTSRQRAEADIAGYLEADSHRVLVGPDGPICAIGFNAATPDIVQIGGVYTPKELRGRGTPAVRSRCTLPRRGRRASRPPRSSHPGASAVAAYEAIGFRRIGDWTIFITKHRERIGG
jgi:hypothetical protein